MIPSRREAAIRRSVLKFVILLFAISIPFWLAGEVVDTQVLQGLPLVDALIAFCPLLAALALVYTERGSTGVSDFLRQALDFRRIGDRRWYLPILLLMPVVSLLSYAYMRAAGWTLPAPQFRLVAVPVMAVGFFVGGIGEELGWTGYATDPMQARLGALNAGIVLGVIWAAWHLPQLLQLHHPPAWIAWWSLGTVASRIIMVWLYDNSGRSVASAILFHVSQNLSWQLFPNSGSHWDPRINGLLVTAVALAVAIGWRPHAFARRGA